MPDHLWVQNLSLTPSLTLPCPSSMPFPRVPSLSPESRAQRLPLCSPGEGAAGCHEASPRPALLWAEQTKGLSRSSCIVPSRPFTTSVARRAGVPILLVLCLQEVQPVNSSLFSVGHMASMYSAMSASRVAGGSEQHVLTKLYRLPGKRL